MRQRTQENQVMDASSHSRISWSRDMNSGFTLISMLLSNILCEHWDSYVFEADDLIQEGRRTRTGEPEDMGQEDMGGGAGHRPGESSHGLWDSVIGKSLLGIKK